MVAPLMLIVDADSPAREALAAALARRYGADYRIEAAASAAEGLDLLRRVQREDGRVALVIADVWLPADGGVPFLAQAHRLHPAALRMLALEMNDMAAMVPFHGAMGLGTIDSHVIKPGWEWPEEWLYPQVQEALTGWARVHGPKPVFVRIVGDRWSPRSHELRDRLARNMVPFQFLEATSAEGSSLLREHGLGAERLPVVVLYGGTVLVDPADAEVAAAMGVRTRPDTGVCDVAIVGAGPAGLAAAVYGASEGLRTVLVERHAMGGQAGTSSMIRNYLGFPRGVSGSDLTSRAFEQALHFGVEFIFASEATGLARAGDHHVLRLADGSELASRAVILATGVTYRRLGIPALEGLLGAGVFYGSALVEAQATAGQPVFIVGAGNSAGQAALHLAKIAGRVTLLVRGDDLAASMSDYLIREIETRPNIDVRLRTQVVDGAGDGRLERLVLEDRATRRREDAPATALFVMIGAVPHTGWVGAGMQRDLAGYILTGRDLDRAGWPLDRPVLPLETSVPGVFAVGDVRANAMKRVASAVGDGSVSIRLVHEYLEGIRG